MNAYTINFDVITKIDDEQFYQLCRYNPELNLERNQKGEIIIMSPTGGETGRSNSELNADFVLKLMSKSDTLKETQDKMQEYMDNGVKLGWLLNPFQKQVEIYRQGQEKEVLNNPKILSGEKVLPEFLLDLTLIC